MNENVYEYERSADLRRRGNECYEYIYIYVYEYVIACCEEKEDGS